MIVELICVVLILIRKNKLVGGEFLEANNVVNNKISSLIQI